jgi:hypothetical protein
LRPRERWAVQVRKDIQKGVTHKKDAWSWKKKGDGVYTHITDTYTYDNTVKKLQLLRGEHIIFNNVFKNNI